MEELIERIGRCKAAVDHGFSRVGPSLMKGQPIEEALFSMANRMIRLSNAAVLLCKNGHSNEAVDLLSSLMETAWSMLWITLPANRKKAPADSLAALKRIEWSQIHLASDSQKLVREAGFGGADLEDQSRRLHEQTGLSREMNNASIPWAHVFGKVGAGVAPENTLILVAASMDQAIKALDAYWPGMFPAPEGR